MNEEKCKSVTVNYQIDLNTLTTIGKAENDTVLNDQLDINIKIGNAIKKALANLNAWVDDFAKLVQDKKYRDAYELFTKNRGMLIFSKEKIFHKLILLDISVLNNDERKDFLFHIILYASKEGQSGEAEPYIDKFLNDFGDSIEPAIRQTAILAKANAAAQNKKTNVAFNYYKKAINSTDTAPVDLAFAYRGLAMISANQKESNDFRYLGIDKFLESGNKQEAIKDLAYLSGVLDNESPKKSLELIDKAINLYDVGNILDKEFAAGLYHRKAGYLLSLGKTENALEMIEKACELRENLLGNEYEKYSSNSVALSLSQILKNDEKIKLYASKVAALSPLIDSQEFFYQKQLEDLITKRKPIDEPLLAEIDASNYIHLKFSAYLHNATLDEYTFEDKLEWLDKAQLLINHKHFHNQHYGILFFNFAETYRKAGQINEAVKNYEQCLSYNPFYHSAIQNCGAILWKAKKWKKSKEFFTSQIEKLGDSPILIYAVARSLYELKDYSSAFPLFRKVNGKVTNVDTQKFINLCLEKSDDLTLTSPEEEIEIQQPSISLQSFQETLKQFAQTISTNSRMHFWYNDQGEYKWVSRPEERGKQHLITALEIKYGKNAIEIIQERIAGAGIIDLYIILRGGLKIVVELKICGGSGYSSTYALAGEDQLVHYIKSTATNVGFLVVFDGRSRDFGLGFKDVQSIDSLTIFTVAIEMTPKIAKRRSSR